MRKRPPTSGSFSPERAREAGRRSAEARRQKQHPPGLVPADGGAATPALPIRPGAPPNEAPGLAGDSSLTPDEGRVVAGLWEEAENSSSATSRVQAFRELRSFYASLPKVEPVSVARGAVGPLKSEIARLARETGVDLEHQQAVSPAEAVAQDLARDSTFHRR